ncbi:MAG: BamA/TamA family outer membrane protein [Deltaproteobacteria bacterium]|nr:BamA/TamA family outer membrane protein [Deltaproteobacteria bacterium]
MTLAACHRHVHPPGEEWLRAIEFKGNRKLTDDELLTGLALHRDQQKQRAADPYLVQVDADRLRGQYVRAGFFDVDVQARVERDGDAVTVIYTIDEGERAHTRVVIRGLPADGEVTAPKVRKALPLADGQPFDYDKFDAARVDLLAVLKNAGYARARLDARVYGDAPTRTATVWLEFTPGPKCTFGTVKIEGAEGELAQAIERRMRFAPGERYSARAILRTQRAIYGIGRFSTVQIEPDNGTSDVVNVVIAVAPSAPRAISFGGGVGIDPVSYEVRTRGSYEIAGRPGPLDKFTVDLRPAYGYLRNGTGWEPRLRALARLERLDLGTTRGVGSVELDYEYLVYEAFSDFGPRAKVGYTLPLGDRWRARAGVVVSQSGFRAISPLINENLQRHLGLDRNELITGFAQTVTADYRDSPIEPRRGWYAELQVLEGIPLGGAYNFQQIVPELRGFLPAGRVTLAARVRAGAIFGEVPPTERFYAGGATSQRGFGIRRLAPSITGPIGDDTRTVPYGGAALFETSFEARIPIATVRTMPVGVVLFLDGGDVTDLVSELSLGDLHWAIGLGVRVKTVIGPVRFDMGFRVNRTGALEPEPFSVFAFHLSLGEAF